MPDRATELATTLNRTEAALNALSKTVGINEKATRKAKFAANAALAGIVLDMVLTVVVGWGLFGVNHNQTRINQLQSQLQSETERNRTAQCAQNRLFLQFEPRTTTNPSYSEEQRAQQVRLYATLRQIVADLQCP